jgi:5'-3' exonuclease
MTEYNEHEYSAMGIPSYFSNVVKQHKNVIKKLSGLPRIHNLYMDTNGLVYDAVRVVGPKYSGMSNDEYETRLIQTVCEKINEYVAMFRPSDKVFIAFDGVAPVAKLNQQRERRYKSWFTSVVEKMIARKNALLDPLATAAGGGSSEVWNTSAITPGTRFMAKLNQQMRDYCEEKARVIGTTVVYIYSGSDIPGEGEHKIFEYIRDNRGVHRDTTTLIYGLDADLIMLCLNHLHISENIYLYRDTPEFIQSLDSTLSSSEAYYLDIPEFACSLERVMRDTTGGVEASAGGGHTGAYVSDATTVAAEQHKAVKEAAAAAAAAAKTRITPDVVAAIDDYIVMTFMLGNDFMPHFPSLNLRSNGMTVLLQTYANMFRQNKETLVSRATADGRPTIVWKTMRAFIALLAETEHNRFMNEHKTRDRQGKQRFGGGGGAKLGGLGQKPGATAATAATAEISSASNAAAVDIRELTKIACDRVTRLVGNMERCHSLTEFMSIPLEERAVERYIDPFRENWEFRYYDALFGVDIYANDRGSHRGGSSVDRLQMICVNYIEGLEWTMRYYSTGCVDWRWTYKYPYAPLLVDLMRYVPHLDTALFPVAAGAVGTTPVKNPVRDLVQLCYVLPMASHNLLPTPVAEKLKRYYSHYYCDKLDFKWSYCKYFWEAHTELPHIRIAELEQAVAGMA